MAEIWFSEKIAPGFFAWVIPLEGSCCRVGLASNSGLVLDKLNSFIKKRFGLGLSFKPRVGQILVDGPLQKTSFDGLLLIGDAAGHVKPTTGGGVVIGGLCAFEAAKTAVKAVEKSNTSSEFLEDYDNSWKNLYQNEFRSMKMLRNVADRINDNQIDRSFNLFKEEGMKDKLLNLVSSGDMDLQNSVIRKALTDPKILLLLTRILGKLILDEMLQFVNV
jgi:flavin-dependent dehydrogenase